MRDGKDPEKGMLRITESASSVSCARTATSSIVFDPEFKEMELSEGSPKKEQIRAPLAIASAIEEHMFSGVFCGMASHETLDALERVANGVMVCSGWG